MQQVDHAMVYVLIAGSYTPVCLLALPRTVGVPFLLAIWAAAAVGMGLKISWKAKRVGHALYLIIGWAALIILPWAYHRAGFTSLLLLIPHIFGFHEVWHVFTVVAGILQFAGVGVLIARVA